MPGPLTEDCEVAWADSVTVPVPSNSANRLELELLVICDPVCVSMPESWPLLPLKSMTPSNAWALNASLSVAWAVSGLPAPGIDNATLPVTEELMVPASLSKFSI